MIDLVPSFAKPKSYLWDNKATGKKAMKGGNSDAPRIQYKVTVLFHQKLKIFL